MKEQVFRHLERPVGSAVVSSERPFLGCDWQRWQQQQHCGGDGKKWCGDVTGMDLAQLARPEAPDALLTQIVLEQKYQPHLKLPTHSQSGEVTVGIRNGSAHVLRCLKVWYDMPSEVLFVALNLMDRFLTRMKVKPKHMACISVSSFQLACKVVCDCEPLDVAVISQCKCSVGDLTRMQAIIATKLGLQVEGGGAASTPTTALTFLRLFHAACLNHHDRLYQRLVGEGDDMWQRLEIVMCDAVCANFRACEVALVVLCCQMDTAVSQLQPAASTSDVLSLVAFVSHLQVACNISEASFSACHEAVLTVVAQYNGETQMPHRQRLVWRVSQRTLRYLRPTDKLSRPTLPTIMEHGQGTVCARPRMCSTSSQESLASV